MWYDSMRKQAEGLLHKSVRADGFAVNRMTDEIGSLLSFSKQREALRPAWNHAGEVIARAIRAVKVLPEFESTRIEFSRDPACVSWFDAG